MAQMTVEGGAAGVRVIVDGDSVNDVTVAAGATQVVEFAGKLEVRVLGIDGKPVADNNEAGSGA